MTHSSSAGPLSLIPLSALPDQTKKPASPHLALVGPVSPAIGTPLFAFSEVDQRGYEMTALSKKASPAQHWMKAFKPALAIGFVRSDGRPRPRSSPRSLLRAGGERLSAPHREGPRATLIPNGLARPTSLRARTRAESPAARWSDGSSSCNLRSI